MSLLIKQWLSIEGFEIIILLVPYQVIEGNYQTIEGDYLVINE